jgi:hypothetical protein
MINPGEALPGDGAAPTWELCSTLDAARLEQVHNALVDAISTILMRGRANQAPGKLIAALDAYRVRTQGLRGRVVSVLPWLCVAGLVLALAFAISGGIMWGGYRIDLFFALYFGAALALVWPLRRLEAWHQQLPGRRPPQWPWLWKALARRISARMLRAARHAAPFEARYVFAGQTVTYARVTPAGADVIWQRTLQGWRVSGTGFTLVLKSRRSLQGVLILHEPSAHLDTWLARLGVEPMDGTQPGQAACL